MTKDYSNIFWYSNYDKHKHSSCKEDGWFENGKKIGYSPKLDKKLIYIKVMSILQELQESGLIYVSNGTQGEGIMYSVALNCKRQERFDSQYILFKIVSMLWESHSDYWKEKANEMRGGSK